MTEPVSTTAPPPVPPALPAPARRRWPVVVSVLAVLVFVLAVAGAVIRLPYVIYSPGDATPVQHVIRIKGARIYEHPGQVLFLTVSVSSEQPNVWRWLAATVDDDSDVIGEHDYLRGQSRARVEKENVAAMNESQLFAKKVALEQLGYQVTATGSGAKVEQVLRGAPADGKLHRGDVITAIDGKPVRVRDEVGEIVRARPAGTAFDLTVTRAGRTRRVALTTAEAPDGELRGKPYLGVGAVTKDLQVEFPVDVRIDPGPVSGPSAGLAFTLTIVDELSPGDLTGGRKVAVTGTIDPNGGVGEVGGVRQKTAAAIDAGAKLFLVPRAEVREARQRAGNHLEVVGVDTIADALRALREHGGAPVQKVAPSRAA